MKNKLIFKIIFMSIFIVFINCFFNIGVLGTTDNFDLNAFEGIVAENSVKKPVNNVAGAILSAMRIISVGIALVILIVIAIKYMVAAPGDRAEIKKNALIYVLGAVILFGSTAILTIIANAVKTALGI